jgi:Glycosyltransferase sugar-binding region containing DXD motif/Alpha 1,4-glycosyltransferase conserved region
VKDPIQSLWIGARLSTLERLSIQSFVDHGHQYHLYTYQELPDLPAGAMLRDANEIFPASEIFQYPDRKSYAAFANVFRYKLLFERGGVWADADVVCLRPFDLVDEYVFASETIEMRDMQGPRTLVTSCVIKAPPGSHATAVSLRMALARDRATLRWGEIGPRLVAQVVEMQGLERFVQPPTAFCPIPYRHWRQLIDPQPPALPAGCYAIHFWNEMWRLADQDRDGDYPESCLYERLKRRYLDRTDKASSVTFVADGGLPSDTAG